MLLIFQPTRPLRGATAPQRLRHDLAQGISTHAPLAGRDAVEPGLVGREDAFQPTRPLRGATRLPGTRPAILTFQPTRPLRGATVMEEQAILAALISTHAPLAGRDVATARPTPCGSTHFNPRAPCGARLLGVLPLRPDFEISTHAPLAGRDPAPAPPALPPHNFNPRAPCGARPTQSAGADSG